MAEQELWQRPVTYAAVGATQAADLFTYPPEGFRPMSRRARIGHGDARFQWAWAETMSWGIQKRSGFGVELTSTPREVVEQTYSPLAFDGDGAPVAPSARESAMFGSDGTPFVVPGDTAYLVIPVLGGLWGIKSPARVVYVVDEPNRKGFAYGTLPGHPESGEESFIVDQTEDGSVWLTITAISRPSSWFWWMLAPVLRLFQEYYTRRYLRALAGPISVPATE
ncbi:DUF1990 family protein [Schumannella luteola]